MTDHASDPLRVYGNTLPPDAPEGLRLTAEQIQSLPADTQAVRLAVNERATVRHRYVRCSFCGDNDGKLVSGERAYICRRCATISLEILAEVETEERASSTARAAIAFVRSVMVDVFGQRPTVAEVELVARKVVAALPTAMRPEAAAVDRSRFSPADSAGTPA